MWRTPLGNRTLTGIEAEIFRFALGSLVAELERDGAKHQSGVKSFDRLPLGVRWVMLLHVSRALLRSDIDVPIHAAASEAAICAVLEQLGFRIEDEIEACQDLPDEEPATEVRTLAFDACTELELTCGESATHATSSSTDSPGAHAPGFVVGVFLREGLRRVRHHQSHHEDLHQSLMEITHQSPILISSHGPLTGDRRSGRHQGPCVLRAIRGGWT